MNASTSATIVALVVQVALGLVVLNSNRHRRANQSFFILCLVGAAWLASVSFILSAENPATAALAIRLASVAGVLILVSLNLLRTSIRFGSLGWGVLLGRCSRWFIVAVPVIALCFTGFFLKGAHFAGEPVAKPVPDYGKGVYLFIAYFCVAILLLILASLRDLKVTVGAVRLELGFLLIGGLAALVLSLPLTLVLGAFLDPAKVLQFAPFRLLLFSGIVAYGIATRKLMEVGVFLRRVISYSLLTAYLLALYFGVQWLVASVLREFTRESTSVAHVVAALVIAFAMAPARGLSQRLAERLFIGTRQLDFRATVSKAAEILQSVTTLPDLLARFTRTVGEAAGTNRVGILLHERDRYSEHPSQRSTIRSSRVMLHGSDSIVREVKAARSVVTIDELRRARPSVETNATIAQMEALDVAAAVGIFARDQLTGLMLLGPRLSGRIYGNAEQNALQVLAGQLAVAIENAELFTEVQNAKIYNETLLQNMTTGVIAAGRDERISVFNREVAGITGLHADGVIDQPVDVLPAPLRDVLRKTLHTGERQEEPELELESEERKMILRASSSIFRTPEKEVLGALLVLTDVTALKRLELQIRRSDRLASLGTLSAGMAHEIKNPLVSIKTFAQLLPERYQDSDFRETFSSLIGHEIDRIDSLVNQLLRFARPAKPLLRPMHVHEVLEKSLQLVSHRLFQQDIKLTRHFDAEVDTIRADADQLEQVFLNFFINAMDAMDRGGELAVSTEISKETHLVSSLHHLNGDKAEVMRIKIEDSGGGIRAEDLAHVFDPFFTTKDYGTGLGLSVVHGIIQEHGGQIEVESQLNRGTAFHILLPLVRFEQIAAA